MSLIGSSLRALAIAGVAAFLVNCGGAGLSPSNPSNAAPPASMQARSGVGADGVSPDLRRCARAGHRVAVRPCNVLLTASHTSATITAYGPDGGTFSYYDPGCTAKSVASVSGSGTSYTVTAGTSKGFCRVLFVDKTPKGRRIGVALLRVFNKS